MLDRIEITVGKTAGGQAEYVQIASPGALPLNIVLVANEIQVRDARDPAPPGADSETREGE